METKVCSKCGRELPKSEFYRNANAKDGLQSCCRACSNEDTPDYWTRLEHQYAGMAMQGLVTRGEVLGATKQEIAIEIADISDIIAHALVEKARYEENPKELEGLKKELEALKIEKTILENKIKLLTEESK